MLLCCHLLVFLSFIDLYTNMLIDKIDSKKSHFFSGSDHCGVFSNFVNSAPIFISLVDSIYVPTLYKIIPIRYIYIYIYIYIYVYIYIYIYYTYIYVYCCPFVCDFLNFISNLTRVIVELYKEGHCGESHALPLL